MKIHRHYLFFLIVLTMTVFPIHGQKKNEIRKNEPLTDTQLRTLIGQMSLEEKVGQMAQVTMDVITEGNSVHESNEPLKLDTEAVEKALVQYKVGSILNTANNRARTVKKWREVMTQLQTVIQKKTERKIPILYGIDAIHGTTYTAGATFFPQQIGMAASRNRALVKEAAAITAYETRASGIPWNFSPVLDPGKDARYPRLWESFGEDVYLTSQLGVQMIKGYEGDQNDIANKYKVASCLKHFLGYTTTVSGKDRTPSVISDIDLRECHIPPFKAAVDAGAHSVMISSGIINGVSVHASKAIITDLLKKELGFKGLVVTDWADIENLHKRDKVAKDMKEAVKLSVNAGIDMSMIPYNFDFCTLLVELVKEGAVSMERIDDAVYRVLMVKNKLGLFQQYAYPIEEYPEFGGKKHVAVAYELAAESMTLLKNESGILPLKKTAKVLVAGPNSNSMRTLNGGWSYSWQGEKVEEFAEPYNTILEAIKNKVGSDNVTYAEGVSYNHEGKYWEEKDIAIPAAIKAAANVDRIILCVGENSYTEKPGDLHELKLSKNQIELTKALAQTGKPIILVLNEGRPRLISEIEPLVQGIVHAYLPGNYGGDVLADILYGDKNPSGKLPYTYPKYPQTLLNYNYKPAEKQIKMDGAYGYESDYAIQYEFGYGLSYTTFSFTDLKVNKQQFAPTDTVEVSVVVKNTGTRSGAEVVQLFVSDEYASITPDNKRLKGFQKIHLEPGASQTVVLKLDKEAFSFINADLNRVMEKGNFTIRVGGLSTQVSLKEDWEEKASR